MKKVVLVLVLLLSVGAVVVAFFVFKEQKITKQTSDNYNEAVESIVNKDYLSARNILCDLEIEGNKEVESDEISKMVNFCDTMLAIGDYKGNASGFLKELSDVRNDSSEFSEKKVEEAYEKQISNVKNIITIQDEVDAIDNSRISIKEKEKIDDLRSSIDNYSKSEEPVVALLNTTKLELAEKTIKHIETKTNVGKTIEYIYDIGDVSLSSSSAIDKAESAYKKLTDEEKSEVINYDLLKEARAKYDKLKKIDDERKEKERIAAEEAARQEAERIAAEEAARQEAERIAAEEAARQEAERIAAEEAARQEAERIAAEEPANNYNSTSDNYNISVWIPAKPGKYHTNPNCSRMKNPRMVTIAEATAMGYGPCGKCC